MYRERACIFTSRFSQTFDQEFILAEKIGNGSFSTVHAASNKTTGQRYAVKIIKKRVIGRRMEPNFVARVQHEVGIYQALGTSLNIAWLHGAYENASHVFLVMQLCTGGELWNRIARSTYSESVRGCAASFKPALLPCRRRLIAAPAALPSCVRLFAVALYLQICFFKFHHTAPGPYCLQLCTLVHNLLMP